MAEETLESLSEKLKIYQKLFESLVPSVPLNTLTPSSQGSLTPSTRSSLTPATPLVHSTSTTPSKISYKPDKRYIKVEEILRLTNLKKNEYNNLLVNKTKKYLRYYILLFMK